MRSRTSPRAVALAVAILAGAGFVSVALAFWGGDGQGQAQLQLGDPKPLILSPGSPSAQLYPGGVGHVEAVAINANPYPVHLGSLALDTESGTGGFSVDAGHSGCGLATLGFVPSDNGGAGWHVPPRAGSTDGSLPINLDNAITMGTDADNACQGATFTVHLVAGS